MSGANLSTAEHPINLSENVHLRRMNQLSVAGLGEYYLSANAWKTAVFPAQTMPSPKPLLAAIGFPPDFERHHARLGGTLPPSGFYRFPEAFIGASGTIMNWDRKIYWSEDLVSAYWMLFLSKMIRRDALGQAKHKGLEMPSSSALGRFLAGGSVPVIRAPDGPTIVCLLKPGTVVYGHWLLDVLPLISQLKRCEEAGAISGPFRYLISGNAPDFTYRLLNLAFGIKKHQIISFDDSAEIMQARDFLVPSLQRVSPLISPSMNDFAADVLSLALPQFRGDASKLPKRFYISREAYATRENKILLNNQDVARAMNLLGLRAVAPEKLSWLAQIALFSRAELIVGEFGSGLHNAIFADSNLISVVMSHMKKNWNQSSIAAIRNQRLAYMKPTYEKKTGFGMGVAYKFDPNVLGDLVRDIIRHHIEY